MGNSFICLDLGASNTRYCEDDGVIHWLPNNMVFIDPELNTKLEEWSADKEDLARENLDILIEKVSGESEYFPVRALIGKTAERFTPNSERPSSLMNKHKQRINYVSAIAATAVAKYNTGLTGDSCNEVCMYVALPPVEARPAQEYVEHQLVGEYKITFLTLNDSVKLKISSVKCMEESYAALLSFFFKEGKRTEKGKLYSNGNVLSIDIGASTTDLAVAQGGRFLERTGLTLKIGGNVVRDLVRDKIQFELGFVADVESLEQAVVTGRLRMGACYQDVGNLVEEAKKEFADRIILDIQNYFGQINIPIQSFMAFVVSGGGSMQGEYCDENGEVQTTSDSMSYYITEKLKNVCSTVAVEHLDDSPRLANIKGMYNKAMAEKKKLEKQQSVA